MFLSLTGLDSCSWGTLDLVKACDALIRVQSAALSGVKIDGVFDAKLSIA